MKRNLGGLAGPALAAAAFVFYLATLAPGLLWGDSAKFQRLALEGTLRFDETGHPLWVLLAHPLTRIPGLDPAKACNLLSAALSSLALWPAWRVMRRLGASAAASALACLALAVSHTWWLHAVITEVYALNSLVTLVLLDFVTLRAAAAAAGAGAPLPPLFSPPPRSSPPSLPSLQWGWALAGLGAGLASGNHLMVALWLPGWIWWILAARRAGPAPGRPALLPAAVGLLAGWLPFLLLRAGQPRAGSFPSLMARLARQALLPDSPGRDALQFAACFLYQFPVPIVPVAAIAGGLWLWRTRRTDLVGLLLIGAANLLFAVSYQVPDRFAFFLPVYIVVALAAAPGFDRIVAWGSPLAAAAAVSACVVAPPFLYAAAPGLIGARLPAGLPSARELPGRDALRFHMDPSKRGDDGARRFCLDALRPLPPGSVVFADYTLNEPLNYMQVAEKLRPDVEVYWVSPARQPEAAADLIRQSRHVYIAARDGLYPVEALSERFEIRPAGPIYELVPR